MIALAAIVLLGLVFVISALVPSNGTVAAPKGSPPDIMVSATGTLFAYPTQATMDLLVNGSGYTALAATQNISSTLNRLNGTLSDFVDGNLSRITTVSYSLYRTNLSVFNYSNYSYGSIPYYTASEEMQVMLPSSQNASPALGSIAAVPHVYVNGVTTQLSDSQISTLRTQALSLALANATEQAQTLAGAGVSLATGNISVSSYNIYPYIGFGLGAAAPVSSPLIYSGRDAVTESITVTFYR